MSIELSNVTQAFATCGIDDCNTTLFVSAIGDVHSLCRWIVPHIIGILSDIKRVHQFEIVSVVNPELSICAVRDEQLVGIAYIDHTLRCGSPGDAVYVPPRKCIHDFDRVVAESSANDALAFCVEGEMIDPPSNIR